MTRTAFAVSLFVSFLGALPAPVAAQAYPARPIRIIVPYPAGGTSDILARSLGEKLTGALGQAVVVENKPGANGNLGADLVAKSPPDGYTLLLADIGALAISPSVYPTLPFDPVRDFAPVTMVAYSPHILVVNPAVPANSVQELVSLTKSKPGKLNFAISGVGGAPHLAGVEFALRTGVKWEYIPYKGGLAGDRGRRCGTGRRHAERDACHLSAGQGRQAQAARGVEPPARGGDPGRSDDRGIRVAGLRDGLLARRRGTAGHAARDRRALERRDRPHPRDARDA